jgi:hypothetical protein
MKRLLFSILLFACLPGFAQINFSFSEIPFSNSDIIAPNRGAEIWYTSYRVQIPTGGGVNPTYGAGPGAETTLNQYWRFPWTDVQASNGTYNWTKVDSIFQQAIRNRRKVGLGIMQLGDQNILYNGYYLTYPLALHNAMIAEGGTNVPFADANSGYWYPNPNSTAYKTYWANMVQAVADHINTTSHLGVPYRKALQYFDIRGHGFFGEWNGYNNNTKPAGMSSAYVATPASLTWLIDAAKTSFPNTQLVVPVGAMYGTGFDSGSPPEIGYYLLTTSNSFGRIGIRRDHWGQNSFWMPGFIENNNNTYNGIVFKDTMLAMSKYAPYVGEPSAADAGGGGGANGPHGYYDLPRQVRLYKATSFGNGNYGYYDGEMATNASMRDSIRLASKLCGYRIIPVGGTISGSFQGLAAFNIQVNWQNKGIAPVYDKIWQISYELRTSGGSVLWSGNSGFNLRLFQPTTTPTTRTDNFTLPNISGSNLSLVMIIRDTSGYLQPFPLAINGRNTDGSYTMATGLTIAASGTPQNPVAVAGNDQSIQLPTTTATLTAAASFDPDGSISSYAWTKLSGPAGGTITSPSAVSTTITALEAGTYSYRLLVTDNAALTDDDTVNIVVGAAAPGNWLFTTTPGGVDTINLHSHLTDGPDAASTGNSMVFTSLPANSLLVLSIANDAGGDLSANNTATVSSSPSLTWTKRVDVQEEFTPNIEIWTAEFAAGGNITVSANWGGSATAAQANAVCYVFKGARVGVTGLVSRSQAPDVSLSASKDAYIIGTIGNWNAIAGPATYRRTVTQTKYDWGASTSAQYFFYRKETTAGTYNYGLSAPFDAGAAYGMALLEIEPSLDYEVTDAAATLGTKFFSSAAGFVKKIRFWLGPNATGTYTVGLYDDATGASLYSSSHSTSGSGWQEHTIAGGGVSILGNKNYVVAAHSTGSIYSVTPGFFSTSVTNGYLTGVSGPTLGNGVYVYGGSIAYPSLAFNNSNYWVDAFFELSSAPANVPPTANAGVNKTIQLPVSSVLLTGSGIDTDGTISSYSWEKVSGPPFGSINSPFSATTDVLSLVAGTYVYRLTVTDNLNATATDEVQVDVLPLNQVPIVNAGSDQTISLPASTVNLAGTASDDGFVTTYAWTKQSGPSATITTPAAASTSVTGLTAGTYVFRLTATDNNGISAFDEVTVTVVTNQAPSANAGADQFVLLPSSTATLSGSGTDADGTVVSYSWAKISGPAGGSISTPTSAVTLLSGLVAGNYIYRLTVTDNLGSASTDDVIVAVSGAVLLDAGKNKTVYANQTTLAARIPPGATAISWSKVSGPSGGTFSNPSAASTSVSGLNVGVYVFRITATISGSPQSDDITVTVSNSRNRRIRSINYQ